jgi:hypothetical protein
VTPAPVFEDIANWKLPTGSAPWYGFQYKTDASLGQNKTLDATVCYGQTIFWKIIK